MKANTMMIDVLLMTIIINDMTNELIAMIIINVIVMCVCNDEMKLLIIM